MSKRVLFAAVLLFVSWTAVEPSANAVTANVTIVANAATDGTHTLNYEATATSAGTVKYIDVSLPSGTGGHVTSLNGTVRTVSTGVLRWTPSSTVKVVVGSRFKIPFYGLVLPTTGEPWTLSFKAISTSGATLSYGKGVTATGTVTASNPIPGQRTSLTYKTKVTRAGTIASVLLYIPAGSSCTVTSSGGTSRGSGAYLTWTPTSPISVSVGTQLSIPIYNLCLSVYGGNFVLPIVAKTSGGTVLAKASGLLPLIAPPAVMPDVPVTNITAPPSPCPSSWPSVANENAQAGTDAWVINSTTTTMAFAAYLTEVSATCGDTVDLKVDSDAQKPVSVVAYRMGCYNKLGAREIWRQDNVPTVDQPAYTLGGTADGHNLFMVSAANWSKTLSIPVDETWVPGTYLIKVSDGTNATYAPLTVRDDTGTQHDMLLQQATTTWSAYNDWGGRSFYSTTDGSGRLSYDRPYAEGQGSGQFLALEQGMVFWLESQGVDVTYWTDNDLDEFGGQVPARAKNLMIPSHDEYYSPTMRASVSQAIAKGVNVASMGANTTYRNISFTTSARRTWDIDRYTSGETSTTWRYKGDAYASQPLLGAEYVCPLPGSTLVTNSSWLFDGVTPGTSIPGFIAGEMDNLNPGLYQHPGIETLFAGTATCRGTSGIILPMAITAYTAPSGAHVFNASLFSFSCYLNRRCPVGWTGETPSLASQQAVHVMMKNVLAWLEPAAPLQLATETKTVPTAKAKAPKLHLAQDTDADEHFPPHSGTGIPPVD